MTLDRRQFLAAAGASVAVPAFAQSTADIAGDVAIVREILTTMHPGLLRYNSASGIAARIDAFGRAYGAAETLGGRFLALSRLTAQLGCGHSYANFFNQKKKVSEALFARQDRLPFAFRWIAGQMVAIADHSGTGKLAKGSIVTRINGVRPAAMLATMMPLTRADGSNDDKRRALLGVAGTQRIETFDVFHSLLYGAPKDGVHNLAVKRPDGGSERLALPAIDLKQRQSFVRKIDANRGDAPIWDWTMRTDGIAVLTMDNWALYDSKWSWEAWLNARLDSLKGAKGLIVDLRANEGGNDCGDLILSRLAGKDIVRPAARRLVRYRRAPEALHPYLDTWDKSFLDWGDAARPYDARFFELKRDGGGVLAAKGPRVDVPLIVLTSAENSSATFQFASLVRQTALGTLLGEATGGNQRGINGGAYFFVRLPASGLEFDLPLIGYFPEKRMPDAGVRPDVSIPLVARDIATGQDRQMAAAVARLGGSAA